VNELGVKEPRGKRRAIDVDDVEIGHGETPRVVDVQEKRFQAKLRQRGGSAAT
jgi:hypothetical protein